MKSQLLGYTVLNIKTKKFVDFDGWEYENDYEVYSDKQDARQIIDEIIFYTKTHNNKFSRKLKNNIKNYKIVKLKTIIEIIK